MLIFTSADIEHCFIPCIFIEKKSAYVLVVQELTRFQAEAYIFIKREAPAQKSSCEFCKFFINKFFTEHLRATVFGYSAAGTWSKKVPSAPLLKYVFF